MEEIIREISVEFSEICNSWNKNVMDYKERIEKLMLKIQSILDELVKRGLTIDFCAAEAVLDLVNNIVEGLRYEDDVLLLDTMQYGWIPYLNLVLEG